MILELKDYEANVTYSPLPYSVHKGIILIMRTQVRLLNNFGKRVRALRASKQFSQEAFADRCGLDRTYISGIERGKRNVSLQNIEVIAHSLGISIAELMDGISS